MQHKEIEFLTRKQIDETKWNNCVKDDPSGLIYSYTWFLDCLTDEWIGLVYKDYQNIMAFPIRRKWGISYIYKPVLIGQLGIFGKPFTASLVIEFLKEIPNNIKLIDYNLNQAIDVSETEFITTKEINYVLNLRPAYPDLSKNYRNNTIRNIRKSREHGQVIKLDTCEQTVNMALLQFAGFSESILASVKKYKVLNQICPPQNKSVNYGYVAGTGELLSSTSIMYSNDRIYYLLSATTSEGKKLGASYKVTDKIIQDYCNSEIIFDFEGSNIPGIAFFYEGFGASAEYYQNLYLNRLPFILRKFKP